MATHVVISGRVQGVGYRAWTADEAIARGLTGWVRNRRDGSVEAVFAGDEEDVAEMVAACRHGPPLARVVNVVANTAHGDLIAVSGEEAFAMLPTI